MEEKEVKELFGFSDEELEQEDFNPALGLSDYLDKHKSIDVTFQESTPRKVEWEGEDEDGNPTEESGSVINVDVSGITYSMWLSAKSLGLGVGRISKKHGHDLEGVTVRIWKTAGQHEKYGDVDYYNVQEIPEQENDLS